MWKIPLPSGYELIPGILQYINPTLIFGVVLTLYNNKFKFALFARGQLHEIL